MKEEKIKVLALLPMERKDFDFLLFHCVPPNKNRTAHTDCPAKVKGEHPKTLSQLYI